MKETEVSVMAGWRNSGIEERIEAIWVALAPQPWME